MTYRPPTEDEVERMLMALAEAGFPDARIERRSTDGSFALMPPYTDEMARAAHKAARLVTASTRPCLPCFLSANGPQCVCDVETGR